MGWMFGLIIAGVVALGGAYVGGGRMTAGYVMPGDAMFPKIERGAIVHVRSSFSDQPGTLICSEPESLDQPVCGAAMAKDEARVTILGVPDRPGNAMKIFSKIAAKRAAR